MKNRLKPLALGLSLLGFIASPAFATISAEDLQKQLNQLQSQVKLLRTQENKTTAANTASVKKSMKLAYSDDSQTTSDADNTELYRYKKYKKPPHQTVHSNENNTNPNHPIVAQSQAALHDTQSSGPDAYINPQQSAETVTQYIPIDITVPGQSFVSSGPYLGVPLVYSGGDLIINNPNINEDVSLLNMRKKINERMRLLGRDDIDDHAHLLLSGIVEGQVLFLDPGNSPSTSDIDLTAAELDGYILAPSHWISGLFAFAYDNDRGTDEGSLNNNARALNSRVFVNKAFIVLGDFERTNWYGTLGQMYVPFGVYSSNMVSSPITRILGRAKQRAILLGYQQQGPTAFYGSVYLFRGDAYVGSTNRINDGGINVGYRFAHGKVYSGDFGFGFLGNLADSQGMQLNGFPPPQFGGFGAAGGYGDEQMVHKVHALNLRALFSYGTHWDFLAEYIGAMSAFNDTDLSYNSHGARPRALNAEAAYTFTAFDKPTTLAVGYGKSRESLAVGLPLARYSLVLNTSWWKDTLQSLEFRHDQNYAQSSYASGNGTNVTEVINGTGKPDNMVTFQFDLYF